MTRKTPERLELPGKPGELWNTVRDLVRAALSDEDGRAAYSIGGGTILAARWGHRDSTDVDLLTTDPQGVVPTTASTERGLAEMLNGELALQANRRHIRVKTDKGPIDVTVDEPTPAGQEQTGHHQRSRRDGTEQLPDPARETGPDGREPRPGRVRHRDRGRTRPGITRIQTMKETMETLILPEPARTTWRAARDVIRELFTDENNGDGYELSGSCVLAARWEHRQDDEVTVVTADPRGVLTPDNKMEKRLEHSLAAKVTRWRASRGARLKTTDGWIVITARRGNRLDRSDSAMVDGVRENMSGTTRILQMILAENEEIAGRDAFDIVTARTSASRELEEALRSSVTGL